MNDYAFVVIGGVLTLLDDVFTGLGSGSFSHTFNAAGSIDVVFGIVDVGDYVGSSWLSIDSVRIATAPATVPEPGSLVLALAGIGVLARRLRHPQG